MRLAPISAAATIVVLMSAAVAQDAAPDCRSYLEQVAQVLEVAQGDAPEGTLTTTAPDDTDRPQAQLSDEEISELEQRVAAARHHLEAGDEQACMVEVQSAQAIAMPMEDSISSEQELGTGGTGEAATGTGQSN